MNKLSDYLANIWISGTISFLAILAVYLINKTAWGYIFSILLAYLIADAIVNFSVRGGGGIILIPIVSNNRTQHKGHGYLAFILTILFSTIASGFISDMFTKWVEGLSRWAVVLFPNIIMIALVYLDFFLTFYRR